ncbi:MAG TPA: FimV/HubP family polar landmark protein, partial [Gammaproteobacteria bacterium]
MRKLTLSLAVMAALLPARGYPLGLGEIELNSALNQELNAEIEILSASPEDAEQLIVQLGSREAFNRAGIDRPYLLQQLKFKVVDRNGAPYIKVFTNSAVREPFLSFLLEIDWPQGNLLREYTLLLDPPVYNTGASTGAPAEGGHPFIDPADTQSPSQSATQQYYPDASAAGGATISSDSGRSMSYQAPAQTRQTSGTYAPAAARDSVEKYRVKENDTLWSMASRMRPDDSVSVEQMMLALVRKNPEAFIQENINGVKRGYILRVPDRDEALQINRQQALSQAREHAALWREYTRAASSATPASAMEAKPAATDSSSAADSASGQLSIVGASEEAGSEHAGSAQAPGSELERLQQELAYAREQLESERIEKETLRSRLSDLEQKVQSVINMDDAQLAELQQSLQQDSATEELATEDTAVDELAEEAIETAEVAAEVAEDAVEGMVE